MKSTLGWLTSSVQALARPLFDNADLSQIDKPKSQLQESSEKNEGGYFGWKSVCSAIVVAVIVICLI